MNRYNSAKRVLLCSASGLLAGIVVFAQMPPGGGSPPASSPQQMPTPMENAPGSGGTATTAQQFSDRAFVRAALEGGDAEIQLGQLAEQKSSSADVKQFGAKMVADHGQLDNAMKPIAKNLGVSEVKGPSKKDKQLMAKLETLSGPQFDEEYIKAMVKDHKKDLKDFQDEAKMAADPNLQKAAQIGSKVVAQHLQSIEQIAQAHNISAEASK